MSPLQHQENQLDKDTGRQEKDTENRSRQRTKTQDIMMVYPCNE